MHAGARGAPAAVRDRGLISFYPHFLHRAAQTGHACTPAATCPAGCTARTSGSRESARAVRRRRRRRGRRECPASAGATSAPAVTVERAPGAGSATSRRWSPPRADGDNCLGAVAAAMRGRAAVAQRPLCGAGEPRYQACCAPCWLRGSTPQRGHRRPAGLRAARDGRRWLPDRPEVGPGARRRRPSTRDSTSSATPTSRSRGPSRTGRSWPSSRTWCSRACCWGMLAVGGGGGLGVHPARVRPGGGGASDARSRRCAQPGWPGPTRAAPARRLSRSRSSPRRAATSSARSRR